MRKKSINNMRKSFKDKTITVKSKHTNDKNTGNNFD